jgi:hypothetical protein
MVDVMKVSQESAAFSCAFERRRHVAWILILSLAAIYGALAVTAPFLPAARPVRSTG